MSLTFRVVRGVLMRISAPSQKYQTGPACGEPSDPTVASTPFRLLLSSACCCSEMSIATCWPPVVTR